MAQFDSFVLAQLLALVALVAATLEYALLIRHREERRRRTRTESEEIGLRGLVRVLLPEA